MHFRTHRPEHDYLVNLGAVAYLVVSVEGLLVFDLPRFPGPIPELSPNKLVGDTTRVIGEKLIRFSAQCRPDVAEYLRTDGEALLEIASKRHDAPQ